MVKWGNWKGRIVVECSFLERMCGGNLTAGSNPAPSAMNMEKLRVVVNKKSVKTKVVQILIIGFCLLVFFDYIFYILCRAKICLPWLFL